LRALPAAANGRHRLPTLEIEHIDAAVAGGAAHLEGAWCAAAGSSVAAGDKYSTPTAVVLAVRVDGHILCRDRRDRRAPRLVRPRLKCLQPWRRKNGRAGDARKKFRDWINRTEVGRFKRHTPALIPERTRATCLPR
jgi:hypothetical protein